HPVYHLPGGVAMFDRLTRIRRDVAPAFRVARELEAHDHWDRQKLDALIRKRLLAIVRHAAAASPYYREAFAGIELEDDVDICSLPSLDKRTMHEHWDAIVTDQRLRLTDVERVLNASVSDEL